jgi:hypothetical protein
MPRAGFAAILVGLATLLAPDRDRALARSQTPAGPDGTALLQRYAAGEHAAVARELARVSDSVLLRKDLEKSVPAWVARSAPGQRRRQNLVAATFLLEVLYAGLETEWRQLRPLLELGCGLAREVGPADPAERLWQLASIALADGARDALLLLGGNLVSLRGHLTHARARFPDEARFLLADPVAREFLLPGEPPRSGDDGNLNSQIARGQKRELTNQFAKLATNPAVAAEAEMRSGYLWFQLGNNPEALARLKVSDERSTDSYVTYLARFLAGRVLQKEKQPALAEQAYRSALDAMAGIQSASQALAALLFVDGRADEAYAVVAQSFERRPLPADPWRLIGYGDFHRFPGLLDQLREAIK